MYLFFLIMYIEELPRKSKVTNEALHMDDDKPIEEVVKKEKKPNAWIEHCKHVKAKNHSMLYKDVSKLAKESYKK